MLAKPHILWSLLGVFGVWAGFPNGFVHLPLLILLFPAALYKLGMNAPDVFSAFRHGWLCSILAFFSVLHWIIYPIIVVGNFSWFIAVASTFFITVILGSAGGVFAWGVFRLQHYSPLRRACILGIIWYFLEYTYAALCSCPWLPLSGALAIWPICIQPVAVIGVYGLSGLLAMFTFLLIDGFTHKFSRNAAVLLALAILLPSAWRIYTTPLETSPQGSNTTAVLFVEGNVDQNKKWDVAFQSQTVDAYLDLTRQGLANQSQKPLLVIWPETAMPFYFQSHPLHRPRILDFAQQHGINMLIGSPGYDLDDNGKAAISNRAFLISDQGHIVGQYDKRYLVPFGEYLPSWLDFEAIKPLLQSVGIYRHGTSAAPLRIGNLAIGVVICYETIFPELADDSVRNGANILVDLSNDGWFGPTSAPEQHLYLTALRAVEQNRWLVRGTNTGISAVCDHLGRIVVHGGKNIAETVSGRVRLQTTPSLFHLLNWRIPLIAGILLILLIFIPAGNTRRNV